MHHTFIQLPVVNGGIKSLLILANDLRGESGRGSDAHPGGGAAVTSRVSSEPCYGLRATSYDRYAVAIKYPFLAIFTLCEIFFFT